MWKIREKSIFDTLAEIGIVEENFDAFTWTDLIGFTFQPFLYLKFQKWNLGAKLISLAYFDQQD